MAEARPLILTRPKPQSEAFAAAVGERLPGRFRVIVAPLMAIVALPGTLDLAGVQGLLFTSANGVEQFAARTRDDPSWQYHELASGHDAMIIVPRELAELLLRAAE